MILVRGKEGKRERKMSQIIIIQYDDISEREGDREREREKMSLYGCNPNMNDIYVAYWYRYKLKDDVRQSLYDCCDEWITAIGEHRPFMGGDTPNLADLVTVTSV